MYQDKWEAAVKRICAHVPEIDTICSMIKGRNSSEVQILFHALANLLLIISGRQVHRAFFPALILIKILIEPDYIDYFYKNSTVASLPPGFEMLQIPKFTFSGQAAFHFFNKIGVVKMPSVLGEFGSEIFFHAVWETYCKDLGVLKWMTKTPKEWADRSEMGSCFKQMGSCATTIDVTPPTVRYYSKLCSAANTSFLGRRETQTINSYVFAGKRQQKFCNAFLESLKEKTAHISSSRKDIPALTKMIQELTYDLYDKIVKKGKVVDVGTVEWKTLPADLSEKGSLVNEICPTSGRFFLGQAIDEEYA